MKKKSSALVLLLGIINYIYTADADHLLLSTICIAPNNAEMIQIYNPTDDTIYLNSSEGKYYLTDATDRDNNKYYYNYPLGSDYARGNILNGADDLTDFFIFFPEGSQIRSGETITIGLHSSALYQDYYSLSDNPEYNDCLIDSNDGNCGVPDYNLIDLINEEIDCNSISNIENCIAGCFWNDYIQCLDEDFVTYIPDCTSSGLSEGACYCTDDGLGTYGVDWVNISECNNVQSNTQDVSILGPEETLILFFWDENVQFLFYFQFKIIS